MNRIFPTLLVLSCLTLSSTAFAQTAGPAVTETAIQGLQIPPTAAQIQLQQQRAKEAERQQALKAKADAKEAERQQALKAKKARADAKQAERQQALKAKVDALQAEVTALKNGEPTRQIPPTQAREK